MAHTDLPVAEWLGLALAEVWCQFEPRLAATPIVKKFEDGSVTLDDYKLYLLNMRQQVKDGARWITRAASSMNDRHLPLRDALIRHAAQEHRDFALLEQNYVAVGGALDDIRCYPQNIGSEALSSYIMHQGSQPNPVHVFGATFIIEGLGATKAGPWARALMDTLGLSQEQVSFLHYHGENDDSHYDNLVKVLASPFVSAEMAPRLVRTAKVVGRLYVLQLEELGNI
ncbi:MAG TPA: 3-oxoacyl-ACP synthase [Gammaproteobacteria bacterium]|nr:3-oxoacyl-ACP synthase [Gammaproteobacteria bacterium]